MVFFNEFLIEDIVFLFISNKRENCFVNILIENLYIESCVIYLGDCFVDVF